MHLKSSAPALAGISALISLQAMRDFVEPSKTLQSRKLKEVELKEAMAHNSSELNQSNATPTGLG